jgi:hypothetical protein
MRSRPKRSNSRFDFVNGNNIFLKSKRSQVTIFIIIAVVIVAGILVFFLLRNVVGGERIPRQLEQAYTHYQECVREQTLTGANILGLQAGYIENPDFEPGSSYMPFSSQLSFLGNGVPYWYYISGNNIVKEQVPSKARIQTQLAKYIQENLENCDFLQYEEQGYVIGKESPEVTTVIEDNQIQVKVEQELIIHRENTTWTSNSHSVNVKSNLGKHYELARKIFLNWKETMFLENYGVDILRLYAPVDGSEITCTSKIWQVEKVREDLINALESNVPAIKIKDGYYTLAKKENKYFEQDIGEDFDANINFLYLREWPLKMEVWPAEDGVLRADPIGLQEGLGMLGFCYVPYHFIYDFGFPVLIQVYNNEEIFQFPLVVYIDKNKPREALDVEGMPDVVPELCDKKLNKMTVSTYNTNLQPVEANLRFKCFDTTCDIGRTRGAREATFSGSFPQCVNGYIIAQSQGYDAKKYLVKNLDEGLVVIILEKQYTLDFEVQKAGQKAKQAVVSFNKNGSTKTISWPEQKQVTLTQGQYEIKTYVYDNTTIRLEGSTTQKCVDVPKSGFEGFLGATEEKCFTMDIPDQLKN